MGSVRRSGFVILWVLQNKEMFGQKRFALPEKWHWSKNLQIFWISVIFSGGVFCIYVGVICNFDRLDLLQISTIFAIFHSFYLAGPTTKCCGWSNVSTSWDLLDIHKTGGDDFLIQKQEFYF